MCPIYHFVKILGFSRSITGISKVLPCGPLGAAPEGRRREAPVSAGPTGPGPLGRAPRATQSTQLYRGGFRVLAPPNKKNAPTWLKLQGNPNSQNRQCPRPCFLYSTIRCPNYSLGHERQACVEAELAAASAPRSVVGAFVPKAQSSHLLFTVSHLLLLQMLPAGKTVYYFVDVGILVECARK